MGSIPSHLFHTLPSQVKDTLSVDFSFNALSGGFPAGLLDVSSLSVVVHVDFNVASNRLGGNIPSTLILVTSPLLESVAINASSNTLTGPLSNSMISLIFAISAQSVSLDLSDNKISGTLPTFLASLASSHGLESAEFTLAKNSLTGALPSSLGPSEGILNGSFVLDVSANQLSGSIPSGLLSSPNIKVSSLTVNAAQNAITGSLPSSLMPQINESLTSLTVSFASNRLAGSLPDRFLVSPAYDLETLNLDLSSNTFIGTIPELFLAPFTINSTVETRSLNLNLANCKLTGPVPSSLVGSVVTLNVNLNSNSLSGQFPFEYLFANATESRMLWFNITAAKNQFTGNLTLPGSTEHFPVFLNLAGNKIEYLVTEPSLIYMHALDISDNTAMKGELPNDWFTSSSNLVLLRASRTALSGPFPSVSGPIYAPLSTLDLSYTKIELCDSGVRAWSTPLLTNCRLISTNSTGCQSLYPSTCIFVATPANTPSGATSPSGRNASSSTDFSMLLLVLAVLITLYLS